MRHKNDAHDMNRAAWDSYHEDYMRYMLADHPDFHEKFKAGEVFGLDPYILDLLGDVRGLRLLDTCCSGDASQSFSFYVLGARVTACDISEKAIEIARGNARRIGADVQFVITDSQYLDEIADNSQDIVFATYPVWLSDLSAACRTWHRVLDEKGRLLLDMEHPISACLQETSGIFAEVRNYNHAGSITYEQFTGTPMADRHGGFVSPMPSVEHFYRVSDVVNAIAGAGFVIRTLHEAFEEGQSLPSSLTIVAEKGNSTV